MVCVVRCGVNGHILSCCTPLPQLLPHPDRTSPPSILKRCALSESHASCISHQPLVCLPPPPPSPSLLPLPPLPSTPLLTLTLSYTHRTGDVFRDAPEGVIIFFAILLFIGVTVFDIFYIVVITNFASQCQLLIYFIHNISERMRTTTTPIDVAIKVCVCMLCCVSLCIHICVVCWCVCLLCCTPPDACRLTTPTGGAQPEGVPEDTQRPLLPCCLNAHIHLCGLSHFM